MLVIRHVIGTAAHYAGQVTGVADEARAEQDSRTRRGRPERPRSDQYRVPALYRSPQRHAPACTYIGDAITTDERAAPVYAHRSGPLLNTRLPTYEGDGESPAPFYAVACVAVKRRPACDIAEAGLVGVRPNRANLS